MPRKRRGSNLTSHKGRDARGRVRKQKKTPAQYQRESIPSSIQNEVVSVPVLPTKGSIEIKEEPPEEMDIQPSTSKMTDIKLEFDSDIYSESCDMNLNAIKDEPLDDEDGEDEEFDQEDPDMNAEIKFEASEIHLQDDTGYINEENYKKLSKSVIDESSNKIDTICGLCGYKTISKHQLKQHISHKHSDFQYVNCDMCDHKTKTKSKLKMHILHKHSDVKSISCEMCDYKTKTKGNLRGHILHKHSDIKSISCEMCDYKTKSKGSLRGHILHKHCDVKSISCGMCDYKTKTKCNLNSHILFKHSDVKTRGLLNNHILQKHSDVKSISCELCDYKPETKSMLEIHILLKHSGSNPGTPNIFFPT